MNEITRTLKIHTYTFGTINTETMKVDAIEIVKTPVKIGPRKIREMEEEKGKKLLTTFTTDVLWGLSIEDFYAQGHAVGKDPQD